MKNIVFFIALTCTSLSFSQNINIKISEYDKKLDSTSYSQFLFVNASYSSSRPLLFIVVNKKLFPIMEKKVQSVFKFKQEYTDIVVLGLDNNNLSQLKDIDNKIISNTIEYIVEFRNFFRLPEILKEDIYKSIFFVSQEEDLCKELFCK